MSDTAEAILNHATPGRKPGTKKTGGRPKGVGNKLTQDAKTIIAKRGRPVEFLADVCRGMKIRVGPQAGPGVPEYVYPDLDQRLAAAKILISRLVPEMKAVELGNNPESPLFPAPETTPMEIGRRVAYLLANGDPGAAPEPRRAAPDDIAAQDFRAATSRAAAHPAPAVPAKPAPPPMDTEPVELGMRMTGAQRIIHEKMDVLIQYAGLNRAGTAERWHVIHKGVIRETIDGIEAAAAAARNITGGTSYD